MATRSDESQARHDRAVELIARERFDGVGWRVHTNPGDERNSGVPVDPERRGRTGVLHVPDPREAPAEGEVLYPDIVCENVLTLEPTVIAEVETEETVNEAEQAQWEKLAALGPTLHVYVPESHADEARSLLSGRSGVLLRTYRLTSGGIHIAPPQEAGRGAQKASARHRVFGGS